jgi:hypothetical protein
MLKGALMKIAQVYEQILLTMPDDLPAKVLKILTRHVGKANRVTRRAMAVECFGSFNPSRDRMIRLAIETLRKEHHIPILALSGAPGYWLAESELEINEVHEEMRKRHAKMGDMVQTMALMHVPAAPPTIPGTASQGRLL